MYPSLYNRRRPRSRYRSWFFRSSLSSVDEVDIDEDDDNDDADDALPTSNDKNESDILLEMIRQGKIDSDKFRSNKEIKSTEEEASITLKVIKDISIQALM